MEEQLINNYLPIAVLFGIALFFAFFLPIASLNLGPKRPFARKSEAYESGMAPIGQGQRRMSIKFYRIAVLFILFDVDIILLVPWAITFRQLGLYGLAVMLIFMVMFILGDVWVWKKGVLEWE